MANKIVVFREALSGQKQAFVQLVYIRYLPEAYNAALREVSRRNSLQSSLKQSIQSATQNLHEVYQQEVAKRERYAAY